MRRMIRTTGIAVAGFVLGLGVASAADRAELAPESRAYLGFSFGGAKAAPRALHYGLRIDQDARFIEGEVAPLVKFDFTRRGLTDAQVNGLSVIKPSYRLRQSEEQAAEEAGGEAPAAEEAPAEGVAEEGGFFSNMWGGVTGFFGGLFGGDDEEVAEETPAEAAAEETADASEAPAEEAAADGAFMNYDVIDWGLLAVGVAGIGLAVSEVAGSDESKDLVDTDGDGIADPPGGGGEEGCPPGTTPNPLPVGDPCVPIAPFAGSHSINFEDIDPEYQAWLDGGTGQMGDLH